MNIQWLGHSSFKLTESTGTTIITDPYHPYVGEEMQKFSCDCVTLSHSHKDHNYIEGVLGSPRVLTESGVFEIKGVHISSFKTFHDASSGSERGSNLIFKFRMDGVDVCHMGDIGEECSTDILENLGSVNVLLIPIGGNYTIDAVQAKEYVDRVMPDIVIPMHYKTKKCELDIDKIDEFVKLFEDDEIIEVDGDTIEFDRTKFDDEKTKLVILKLNH